MKIATDYLTAVVAFSGFLWLQLGAQHATVQRRRAYACYMQAACSHECSLYIDRKIRIV